MRNVICVVVLFKYFYAGSSSQLKTGIVWNPARNGKILTINWCYSSLF